MTREEALKEIRSWAFASKRGLEVLETLIPELRESGNSEKPYNLDEAAEAYSKEVSNGHSYRDLIVGFKAGAKWMTEQGQSKEGIVCDNNEFIKFPDGSYIDLCPDLYKMAFDVKDGEKVIVQIRKIRYGRKSRL